MNQKNRILFGSLLALASLFATGASFTGCANTPAGVMAQEGAGDLYANYELGQVTSAPQAATTIAALTRLQTDLPLIPAGKVSQQEAGALAEQLAEAKVTILAATSSEQKVIDDINSLAILVSQNVAGSSGGMTSQQGLLVANFTNAAYGIGQAIQYNLGKWSISHSDWIPPATK